MFRLVVLNALFLDFNEMGKRRLARELAVQVLFHMEFSPNDPSVVFDLICENFSYEESSIPFSKRLVQGITEKKEELDSLIRKASKNWRLERMPRLDRCIIRLAVFEMAFLNEIPARVSIDEALEIGKRYGSTDSGRFINGVLDNIYNTLIQQGRLKDKES